MISYRKFFLPLALAAELVLVLGGPAYALEPSFYQQADEHRKSIRKLKEEYDQHKLSYIKIAIGLYARLLDVDQSAKSGRLLLSEEERNFFLSLGGYFSLPPILDCDNLYKNVSAAETEISDEMTRAVEKNKTRILRRYKETVANGRKAVECIRKNDILIQEADKRVKRMQEKTRLEKDI